MVSRASAAQRTSKRTEVLLLASSMWKSLVTFAKAVSMKLWHRSQIAENQGGILKGEEGNEYHIQNVQVYSEMEGDSSFPEQVRFSTHDLILHVTISNNLILVENIRIVKERQRAEVN